MEVPRNRKQAGVAMTDGVAQIEVPLSCAQAEAFATVLWSLTWRDLEAHASSAMEARLVFEAVDQLRATLALSGFTGQLGAHGSSQPKSPEKKKKA
ncbi:MAG: DUF7706 family protein [Acidiferrobacterales bacterium]